MLRIVAIALLSFAAALITAAHEKTDASADKSMILALESAWNQAEIHHDASAATAIIADTFISIDHHGVILNDRSIWLGSRISHSNPKKSSTPIPAFTSTETSPSLPAAIEPKARIAESPSCIADDLPTPGSSGMENGSVSQIKRP
jgi:hypothetical protein